MIPYENLHLSNHPFEEEFRQVFDEVLHKGRYILGEKVEQFENAFAHYLGVQNCIGVASGTDAIMIALKVLELPKDAEVIIPDNTFIGTALAVLHAGCKPILARPNPRTYNIDEESIRVVLTPRTRAVIAVHMYGKCCDMEPILRLAKEKEIYVIEDAAHAHGAMYKGMKAGTFGHLAAFSFYPTKLLGALGDGGAVATNDDNLANKVRKWRNYGFLERNNSELPGFNSRLDELQAAFLSVKLRYLDQIIAHKRHLASIYFSELRDSFILPDVHPDYFDVYYAFVVRHPKRDEILKILANNNIGYNVHYPKWVGEHPLFGGKEIEKDYFSLPLASYLTEMQLSSITRLINAFSE